MVNHEFSNAMLSLDLIVFFAKPKLENLIGRKVPDSITTLMLSACLTLLVIVFCNFDGLLQFQRFLEK